MKKRRSTDAAIDLNKISESDGLTLDAAGVSKVTLEEAVASDGTSTKDLGLEGRGRVGRVSAQEPPKSFHVNASESGVTCIGDTDGIILS